jgi:hypothetical protein
VVRACASSKSRPKCGTNFLRKAETRIAFLRAIRSWARILRSHKLSQPIKYSFVTSEGIYELRLCVPFLVRAEKTGLPRRKHDIKKSTKVYVTKSLLLRKYVVGLCKKNLRRNYFLFQKATFYFI